LDRDEGELDAGAAADACDQLIADPVCGAGMHFPRVDHPASDGEDGAADPGEWDVVSDDSH
jgi:hypothetical protein